MWGSEKCYIEDIKGCVLICKCGFAMVHKLLIECTEVHKCRNWNIPITKCPTHTNHKIENECFLWCKAVWVGRKCLCKLADHLLPIN